MNFICFINIFYLLFYNYIKYMMKIFFVLLIYFVILIITIIMTPWYITAAIFAISMCWFVVSVENADEVPKDLEDLFEH